MFRRSLGASALFTLVYSSLASAVYFSLGIVADHALGLTPVVLLVGGLFFVLCAMTYVEGASLHPERAGSTVFARYAFNELWSFVAGWAIVLDYAILVAICAFTATNYAAAFWAPLGQGPLEVVLSVAIVLGVAAVNIVGPSPKRLGRLRLLTLFDLGLQLLVIVLGVALLVRPHLILDPIHVGTAPSLRDVAFALTVAAVSFTGLESASGLAGEVRLTRRELSRLVAASAAVAIVLYVGISTVALSALPVRDGATELSRSARDAPVLGIAGAFQQPVLTYGLRYAVGAGAVLLLIAGANSAMLGLSRLAYSLATNRQIPSALGRLHPTWSTPWVAIVLATAISIALLVPQDLDFLIGIFAFGAMLAFTIAHAAICALRYREPERKRPYRVPLSVRVRGGSLPLPAVVGAGLAGAGWVSVIVLHAGARYVGSAWMLGGLLLYVVYRKTQDKPVFKRVTIPARSLRRDPESVAYGSILVPLTGTSLDDDIVQTAGRLASEDADPDHDVPGAVIETLWIFEVPLALPIDARLPEGQLERGRAALARAKAIGEEYEGVEVATATVRARRTGQAIVEQARRRGVEAIVLAAEEPSRTLGGSLLGGRGGAKENFIGEATKYVIAKAPCRVVLTAPPAEPAQSPAEPAPPVGAAQGS